MDPRDLLNSWVVTATGLAGGIGIVVFDILRKTVFLGASWNYDYPAENLVYDPAAVGLFLLLGSAIVIGYPYVEQLDPQQFIAGLTVITVLLSALAFFATPEKSARWISPTSGYYRAAEFAATQGLFPYIEQFHTLGTIGGTEPNRASARYLVDRFQTAPFPEWLRNYFVAYVDGITVQKHGLIPPLVVAPTLVVLGPGVPNAAVGSYAVTVLLPLITYFGCREYTTEGRARLSSLIVATSPAYLIYQRYESVAWDAITAVWIGAATAFLLAYLARERERYLVGSGIAFSLALLSKASAGTFLLAVVPLLGLIQTTWRGRLRSLTLFGASSAMIPVALIPLGYNFLIQYAFTFARLQVESSSFGASHPAAYLNDPVLYIAGPLYNGRLVGPVVVLLIIACLVCGVVELDGIAPGDRWRDQRYVALLFVLPLFPYAYALPGRTIARHLLPYLTPLALVAVVGFEILDASEATPESQLARVTLGVNLAVALVSV